MGFKPSFNLIIKFNNLFKMCRVDFKIELSGCIYQFISLFSLEFKNQLNNKNEEFISDLSLKDLEL